MKKSSVFIKGVNEGYLNVLSFLPSTKPKAILHISHGMGEHAQRYTDFATFLTEHGIAVYAHDHRAHGKSLRPNQDVGMFRKDDSFDAIVQDVDVVIKHIKGVHKDVPINLLGHSMGSIILRRYLQLYHGDIEKAVIMGTLPKYSTGYTKMMRLAAFLMTLFKSNTVRAENVAKLMNDGLIKDLPHQTKFDWITKDTAIVNKYNDDPLCGYAYNKRFYKDFFKTIEVTNKTASIKATDQVPLLFIAGKEDPVGNHFKGVETVFNIYQELLPEHVISLVGIDDARHEVLNELNKEKTYQLLLDWLQ